MAETIDAAMLWAFEDMFPEAAEQGIDFARHDVKNIEVCYPGVGGGTYSQNCEEGVHF